MRVAFLIGAGLFAACIILAMNGYLPTYSSLFVPWVQALADRPWDTFFEAEFLPLASPGWLLWLGLLGKTGLAPAATDSGSVMSLQIQAPAIAAVVLLGMIGSRWLGRWNQREEDPARVERSVWSVALIFSPALIYNSAVLGQFESVVVLLGVATVHFTRLARPRAAAAAFGLLFAVQPLAILFLPFILLSLSSDRACGLRRATTVVGTSFCVFLAMLFHFWHGRWSEGLEYYDPSGPGLVPPRISLF